MNFYCWDEKAYNAKFPKPHELLLAEQTQVFGAFQSNGGKGGASAKSELSARGEARKQYLIFIL